MKLYGFPLSNYYNVVKAAILEKGVPFEEINFRPSGSPDEKQKTPMGKVPYVETEKGPLSESQVIMDYLEETFPENPLYPGDPFERAKVRELLRVIELYIELPSRRLYPEVFFGGSISDQTREEVRPVLDKAIESFRQLARFDPCVAGRDFTFADITTVINLPLARAAYRKIYGGDVFERLPGIGEYLTAMRERPSFQRVYADQKKSMEGSAAPK